MKREIILGIDGGGTHTRVAAVDTCGNILSYTEKGASSMWKDLKAKDNVHQAINEAVEKAGCKLGDVIALAAGVAGFDSESDLEWVRGLTQIEGLECPKWHVNDAVIAHAGAFLTKPGIIAISGTGSIIFGINESKRQIRNYDFHHYAATAARFISYDSVYKIIAGETDQSDNELVKQVLKYFGVSDIPALASLGADEFIKDRRERDRFFGNMAPMITEASLNGSHLAMSVCDSAAAALATGIRLVGSLFSSDTVLVALVGSVVNSIYIKHALSETLSKKSNKEYKIVELSLPAVLGAVLMAMEHKGIPLHEETLKALAKYPEIITDK